MIEGLISISIITALISLIIIVPLSALMLFLSSKIFKVPVPYSKALIPALIIGGIGFLFSVISALLQTSLATIAISVVIGIVSLLVSIALHLTLPTLILKMEWGKGLLIGLVWGAFNFVVGLIVAGVLFIIALIGTSII